MAAVTSPAATAAAPVAGVWFWATEVPEAGSGVGVACAVVMLLGWRVGSVRGRLRWTVREL